MPTISKSLLVVMLLCWLTPVQAFFCFSFGGHAKGKDRHGFGQHYFRAPPPPLFMPRVAERSQHEADIELPAIAPVKEMPVIIQGYRFRPLHQGHQPDPQTPALSRQK
jgi:hypothetical protein